MRAAVIHELGPAESIRLEDVQVPRPSSGEVLVRVSATTANHVDTFVRSGAYVTRLPFPFTVGRDVVGFVEAVGSDVVGVSPGDPVWCNSLGHDGRQGAAAEFALVPMNRLYRVPSGVDPIELIALAHPAATAWLALVEHGHLGAAGAVFVGGAGGNVGSCAVGFARALDASVVGTAGSHDLARLADSGVLAFDYRDPGLGAALERAARGTDVWLDTSGTLALSTTIPLLAERGRIVLVAGIGRHDRFTFGDLYTYDRSIVGFAISNATVAELARAATAIGDAMASGALWIPPIEVRPLAEMAAVHSELESGKVRGRRIVLTP